MGGSSSDDDDDDDDESGGSSDEDPSDEDLSDNVFQVNISRLRKKLEGTGMSIRQIRGFGYLLQHAAPATGRD